MTGEGVHRHSELEPKNRSDVSLSLNMMGQILRRFIPQNDNGEIMPGILEKRRERLSDKS